MFRPKTPQCVEDNVLNPWIPSGEEDGGSSNAVPDFCAGDSLKVKDIRLAERQTTPPDYLTESDLITLMEKHGIGTDASIPVHINNIR